MSGAADRAPGRLGYDLEALRECLAGVGGDATASPPRYRSLHVLGRCASTNGDARALLREGAEDGTVVVADEQTGGRGRLDRIWHSPPGVGLYVSVILRERDVLPRLTLFPLLAGVALADAFASVGAEDIGLKWPNDVLLEGRKAAGVLCEYVTGRDAGGPDAVIVGVGVNVAHLLGDFPPDLRDAATSLRVSLGRPVPRETVLCRFLAALGGRLAAFRTPEDFPWEAWRARSCLEGRTVEVVGAAGSFGGTALRVDPDGALVVRTAADGDGTEERRVLAGEVRLRGTGRP